MNFMFGGNIKFISSNYIDIVMTEFMTIFRRFPTTFRRFSKIFQNCFEGQTNVTEHFPRIAKDFRGRPEDVSIIHQRI